MLTLVSKDSVKISDHFDVLCVLIACMVLEIINQMSKNQKSSLIVWNTVRQYLICVGTNPLQLHTANIEPAFWWAVNEASSYSGHFQCAIIV